MDPPSKLIVKTIVALFVLNGVAAAQRSSPQFSFPSQNGADLFSPSGSGGDLTLQSQVGQQLQSQQQASQPNESSQLISQSLPQQQQQQPSQATQQQQQQQQQQQANRQPIQAARPAASQVQASSAAASSQQQQQQQNSRHRPGSSSGASHSAGNQHHHHQQAAATGANAAITSSSRHPANMQFHQSQSSLATNQLQQQAAIEAGRRADASAASQAASAGHAYQCPDSFGYFRHHKSCDKYWACDNGTATLKLCGNGLMFDDSDPRRENCAYPFSVDCGSDRTDIEPPLSTPHCPRLYGLFADTANCRVFYSCWNGEASRYECPAGLAYDSEHRVCVWADHVDRCDQSEVSDGFVCPDPTEADQPGHYTRHAHPTDCRKFYVCIEGVARPYGCSIGTVFNVDTLQCDEPDNVSGCEKYYGDLDPKLAKKLAKENVQQSTSGSAPSRSAAAATASASSSQRGGSSRGDAVAAAAAAAQLSA